MSAAMRDRERFSPAQCRAARGLLNWSPADLARRARVELEAVELYEAGDAELGVSDLVMVGHVLSEAGVIALAEKIAGEGVRFRQRRTPFVAPTSGARADEFDALPLTARRDLVWRVACALADWLASPLDVRGLHGG